MGAAQSRSSDRDGHSGSRPPVTRTSPKPFIYGPLLRSRFFRILHLGRSREHEDADWMNITLNGKLVDASLDRVPEYYALSYTWGDPTPCEKIFIRGRVLYITQSCADALRLMLKGRKEILIWVDSICINQAHDARAVQERNRQVALMGEIYSRAVRVNVFLGMGNDKTDAAIIAVKDLGYAALNAMSARSSGYGFSEAIQHYEKVADDVFAKPPAKIRDLFNLPWFRRVWVFQEVALGRKTMFYCGSHTLDFETMYAAIDVTYVPYSKVTPKTIYWRTHLRPQKEMAQAIWAYDQGLRERETELLALLIVGINLMATRPVDKVYGLYGCAKRLGLNPPAPDYTKSMAQVYTDATLACFRQFQSLDLLTVVEGVATKQNGLPSWVLDLSHSIAQWSPTSPARYALPLRDGKARSATTRSEWIYIPKSGQLKVLGRRLDQVSAVGKPLMSNNPTDSIRASDPKPIRTMQILCEALVSWLEVITDNNCKNDGAPPTAATGFVAVSDLAFHLVNAHSYVSGLPAEFDKPPEHFVESLEALVEWERSLQVIRLTHSLHAEDEICKCPRNVTINVTEPILQTTLYVTQWYWKTIFRTERHSYIGTGSYSSQPGDLIVAFRGMRIPFLLRPCAEGYTFVSRALVDGFMGDELGDVGSALGDEWFALQ